MRLLIDTSEVMFMVTRGVEPKVDRMTGVQKMDRLTGAELYTIELMALDNSGGEVITVTIAGPQREVPVKSPVDVVELEAIPWNTDKRSGVAYRAKSVTAQGASSRQASS